jgi:hypothetical protein
MRDKYTQQSRESVFLKTAVKEFELRFNRYIICPSPRVHWNLNKDARV